MEGNGRNNNYRDMTSELTLHMRNACQEAIKSKLWEGRISSYLQTVVTVKALTQWKRKQTFLVKKITICLFHFATFSAKTNLSDKQPTIILQDL